jgi:hypothetical protein
VEYAVHSAPDGESILMPNIHQTSPDKNTLTSPKTIANREFTQLIRRSSVGTAAGS